MQQRFQLVFNNYAYN